MFWFKKYLASVLFPLPLCMIGMGIGFFFLWRGWKKTGRLLVGLSFVSLYVFGSGPLVDPLMNSLEQTYPVLESGQLDAPPQWIVVLGGGALYRDDLPDYMQLNAASLGRVAESVRLHHLFPTSRILYSGKSPGVDVSQGALMAAAARSFGIPDSLVVIEGESLDTKDQARIIAEIVGGQPAVLVTSATHMPRAMAMFEKQGTRVTAAPSAYLSPKRRGDPRGIVPASTAMAKMRMVVYELLGRTWAKMRGQT